MFELSAIIIGGIIGLSCAVVGAIIDYRKMKRRQEADDNQLPGCMFVMSGSLGMLGAAVVAVSFLLDSVARAVTAGVGVITGFVLGFVIMMGAGLLFDRF